MQRTIDLNSDLGEGCGLWRAGDDHALLRLVTGAHHAAVICIIRETHAAEGFALAPSLASL